MNAELAAAKRRALAAELDAQQNKLAETEELRSQLLAHVQHFERELMEKQRQARVEAGHMRAASHRSELKTQLLELRWEAQGASADRALARRSAADVASRFGANQRQQEGLLLRAIELEGRAAAEKAAEAAEGAGGDGGRSRWRRRAPSTRPRAPTSATTTTSRSWQRRSPGRTTSTSSRA